ncbi:hypothetical protein SEA_HAMMY_33 [Mycobacterium phage Hammy]|uniref:Uncharacterized protein n=2 Tax=Amginevirus TaxID=2946794 RepID=A0A222ZNF9_9CAUD|nr:hypothetical protein I5G85_gp66 [Mycobacterium phage Amohnition]YP_009951991.1 hypothetical protein I5G86_gp66 [Mycobacterium phage DarthP]APD18200.1 hypothetical protein SEA_HAMMY_33 [Mycobacterium phage Hammy]ASR86313.1 hypothetical protein SEA_AMOHNITION_33 [Mycobacterium phage Amohnition]ASW31779.1 hypothetical protein SEA_DARTHP_33 [Mycobacterium phage DarthP]
MSLADRLGDPQPAPSSECVVCRWLAAASDGDRLTFDRWIAEGGSLSALWRSCATDPTNPLTIKRPRFSELVNDHHRGGARVSV